MFYLKIYEVVLSVNKPEIIFWFLTLLVSRFTCSTNRQVSHFSKLNWISIHDLVCLCFMLMFTLSVFSDRNDMRTIYTVHITCDIIVQSDSILTMLILWKLIDKIFNEPIEVVVARVDIEKRLRAHI